LSPFDHVGQQRYAIAETLAGLAELFLGAQRFDEQRIDTACQIRFGAIHCRAPALDGERIGSYHDQRACGCARIERRTQLSAHFGHRDHLLFSEMAAAWEMSGLPVAAWPRPHA
jgi:hypothetical protein